MYKIRLSVFRKYTFAAVKGLTPSTVPEALANPATSEAFFGCALAIFKSAATPSRAIPMTKKPCKLNRLTFLFIWISSKKSLAHDESKLSISAQASVKLAVPSLPNCCKYFTRYLKMYGVPVSTRRPNSVVSEPEAAVSVFIGRPRRRAVRTRPFSYIYLSQDCLSPILRAFDLVNILLGFAERINNSLHG